MGCSVSHSRRKEKGGGHTWWMLVAGKGLGEDVTYGAAARPVVAASEGRAREERERESERRECLQRGTTGNGSERLELGGLLRLRANKITGCR